MLDLKGWLKIRLSRSSRKAGPVCKDLMWLAGAGQGAIYAGLSVLILHGGRRTENQKQGLRHPVLRTSDPLLRWQKDPGLYMGNKQEVIIIWRNRGLRMQ